MGKGMREYAITPSVSNLPSKRRADIVDSHTAFRKKEIVKQRNQKTIKMANSKNKC